MFAFLGNILNCLSRNIHFKWSGKEQSILNIILHVSFHSVLIAVLQMQADHPLCLRLRDAYASGCTQRIRCLISYVFWQLLQLTSDWFNWSREMLPRMLHFAFFYPKLCSPVSETNKFTFFFIVCVVFCGLMGFESVLKLLATPRSRLRRSIFTVNNRKKKTSGTQGSSFSPQQKRHSKHLWWSSETHSPLNLCILSHFHASVIIQPPADQRLIIIKSLCQKSSQSQGSNVLKSRHEFIFKFQFSWEMTIVRWLCDNR